ncbi:uncharacterized protein LOC126797346 [Argentina anserina]|uniref:uncharacterized protein LOC126797346 n=1 Tax=Argentina anserina TaxID=57926 RepID=UPI0021764FEC|nr:uncharacterized protein LOC126797346 [Potentilla anserina]
MGGEDTWRTAIALVPPRAAPLNQNAEKEDVQWSSNFNNSVNAVYMGFVATAILISMFIIMAIFERFFRRSRPTSQPSDTARTQFSYDNNPKLDHNSSKITNYAREVSVVMPGENTPTFIAHPAPPPCPREHVTWPLHSINASHASTSTPTPEAKF